MFLDAELKRTLLEQASDFANDPVLVDGNIQISPLELSTQNFDLLDSLHHHRQDIAARLDQPPLQIIQHSQLFNAAKDAAISESARLRASQEEKEHFQLLHGNVIWIIGQSGAGKTMLAKYLAHQILSKDSFEILVCVKFCDIEKNMTFLQFLTNNSPFSKNLSKEESTMLLHRLSTDGEVCIVCDGFDDIAVGQETPKSRWREPSNDEEAWKFIKRLLRGDFLPKAKKLFTSCPGRLLQLEEHLRPRFFVKMPAIKDAARKEICRFCSESESTCEQILRFLLDRPDLQNFCSIPTNCMLVMYSLSNFLQTDVSSALAKNHSITTILLTIFRLFIEDGHQHGQKLETSKLSSSALTAFKKKSLFLDLGDVIAPSHAITISRRGMIFSLKLMKGKVCFYFSNFLLREFFVALYITLYMDAENFLKSLFDLKTQRYEMVSKFVFGLCSSVSQDCLEELIPFEEFDPSQYQERKEKLKKFASEQVDSARSVGDLLQIFHWLYELQDDEFTKKVAAKLKDEFKASGLMLPSDVPALQYVLKEKKSSLLLEITHPTLSRGNRLSFFIGLDAILRCDEKVEVINFRSSMISCSVSN